MGEALPASDAGREDAVIEIRQLFEAEDFGEEFTPEMRRQEELLRVKAEKRAKA